MNLPAMTSAQPHKSTQTPGEQGSVHELRAMHAKSDISQLKYCSTEKAFKQFVAHMSPFWIPLIQFYLTDCFVFDIYNSEVQNKIQIVAARGALYTLVSNSAAQDLKIHLCDDVVKNFCSILADFFERHYDQVFEAVYMKNCDEESEGC